MLSLFEGSLPKGLLHPCPYTNALSAFNVSMDPNQLLSKFLSGNYKATFHLYDDDDTNVLTMILELEFTAVNTRNQNGKFFTF